MLYYIISVINGTPVYIALSSNCTVNVVDPFMTDNWWVGATSTLAISGWLSQIPTVLSECFFTIGPLPTSSLHYVTFLKCFLKAGVGYIL